MRIVKTIACVLLVIVIGVTPGRADKRVALVIGNAAYRNVVSLDNPANDAKLIADTLQTLGFTLVGGGPQLDLDKASLDRRVREFRAALLGADVGLFYYAGHGVQVRGENFLVPVDANPVQEADVDFEMLDAAVVLRQMEASGARLKLVILDACRNNPFRSWALAAGRGRDNEPIRLREIASGLREMPVSTGTLISFAAQPGSVARDGTDGNSPYTRALADAMRLPGLGIFETFNQVSREVNRVTGASQLPYINYTFIDNVFYFVPPQIPAPQPAASLATGAASQPSRQDAKPAPRTTPGDVPGVSSFGAAEGAWTAVRDTNNVAFLEAFVRRFGDTFYADLARLRIDELKKQQTAAVVTPAGPAVPPVTATPNTQLSPKDVITYFIRGSLLSSESSLERLIAKADQAIKLNPKDASAFADRAGTYLENGFSVSLTSVTDLDRAIADLDQAIKLDPKMAQSYLLRGVAYWAKGDQDRAIGDLDDAIRLDPNRRNVPSYLFRAFAYLAKGDEDRATADLDEAIRLDPKTAYVGRGIAFLAAGKQDRAIADFDKAIGLDPRAAEAYNARCWAHVTLGQFQPALSDCNESLRIRADNGFALDSRGFVHLQLGHLDDSIDDFDAALKIRSKLASSIYGRGLAELKRGETFRGNADIELAKAIEPGIAESLARDGIK